MTRFWFTLESSAKFVLKCLKNMSGGEIFVPKIPSVKIVDLAKAMDPKKKLRVIGVRPGEKLHELMCPKESSSNTLEFKDFFIIFSSEISLNNKIKQYKKRFNERGKKVFENFEYNSKNNTHYLTIKEIKNLNNKLGLN